MKPDCPHSCPNFSMLKKDLTKEFPRSVHDQVLGVVMLGRTIDKGAAFANGLVGEYNYDCPMDQAIFSFLGVDGNALLDAIKKANSEADVLAFLKPYVDKKSAEIATFNKEFLARRPEPGSESEEYFLELRNAAAPGRTDVTTWADLLDLDEKRVVPQRTAA